MLIETEYLDALRDGSQAIERAAGLLRQGRLVAFPTETVYGLGAAVFSEDALQNIFTAKGRPPDNPLIVHIARVQDIESLATEIPETFYRLAERFFPGPLAVILRRHPRVPAIVSAGLDTIAVRMPDHEIALELISRAGQPLAAPSANISGRPSPTTASHVMQDLSGRIAAVLDGGPCRVGIESTVISILNDTPVILRPGIITPGEIEDVLREKVEINISFDEKVSSPGMKYRHYAPHARIRLVETWEEFLRLSNEDVSRRRLVLTNISPDEQERELAHRGIFPETLYAEFRRADDEGYDEIVIILDPELLKHAGLMNRIAKAAGKT